MSGVPDLEFFFDFCDKTLKEEKLAESANPNEYLDGKIDIGLDFIKWTGKFDEFRGFADAFLKDIVGGNQEQIAQALFAGPRSRSQGRGKRERPYKQKLRQVKKSIDEYTVEGFQQLPTEDNLKNFKDKDISIEYLNLNTQIQEKEDYFLSLLSKWNENVADKIDVYKIQDNTREADNLFKRMAETQIFLDSAEKRKGIYANYLRGKGKSAGYHENKLRISGKPLSVSKKGIIFFAIFLFIFCIFFDISFSELIGFGSFFGLPSLNPLLGSAKIASRDQLFPSLGYGDTTMGVVMGDAAKVSLPVGYSVFNEKSNPVVVTKNDMRLMLKNGMHEQFIGKNEVINFLEDVRKVKQLDPSTEIKTDVTLKETSVTVGLIQTEKLKLQLEVYDEKMFNRNNDKEILIPGGTKIYILPENNEPKKRFEFPMNNDDKFTVDVDDQSLQKKIGLTLGQQLRSGFVLSVSERDWEVLENGKEKEEEKGEYEKAQKNVWVAFLKSLPGPFLLLLPKIMEYRPGDNVMAFFQKNRRQLLPHWDDISEEISERAKGSAGWEILRYGLYVASPFLFWNAIYYVVSSGIVTDTKNAAFEFLAENWFAVASLVLPAILYHYGGDSSLFNLLGNKQLKSKAQFPSRTDMESAIRATNGDVNAAARMLSTFPM